jgi:thioredoxin 1
MDVDKSPITPQRYGVRGIPTLLIFKNGQVQEQIVGYVGRDVIEKALNKQVNVIEMPKAAGVEKTNVR